MAEQSRSRGAARLFSHSVAVIAGVTFAALLSLGLPEQATSQIASKVVSVPKFGAEAHATQAKLPKAPVQVTMPAPPPIKIFPGLEEPLVATGPVTDAEGKDLDAALKSFHDLPLAGGKDTDYSDFGKPLMDFVKAHPNSNWNSALLLNIGLGYYHSGYYSRAFPAFEQSWLAGRDATTPQAHIMVDRAVGELARMYALVGHAKDLEALFADMGKRPIGGPATEMIQGAREGLWAFTHDVGHAYLCGPMALRNVLVALKASDKQIQVARDARSGPHGFSLTQLAALADKAKLKYKLIYRKAGQPIPVPSIINWNVHHYAAITAVEDGRYIVEDPTFFGGMTAMTQKALDAEGSGYFLVPAAVAAANKDSGWRTLSAQSDEAKAVYGMGKGYNDMYACNNCTDAGQTTGVANGPVPNTETPSIGGGGCGGCGGMTVARGTPMEVGLHLTDTPVGYRPQVGIPNLDTLTYNAREDIQPATFSFSNVSPKWSHGWQAYIVYDPRNSTKTVERIAPGGGGYYWTGVLYSATGMYRPESVDNSQLFRYPTTGTITAFTRTLPDGSKEVYDQPDGGTSYPSLMFLTKVYDKAGNLTTLSWSNTTSGWVLNSITDAMGRTTSFTYGLSGYPLLITKITDPFSRTAQFTYDTSARLASITDPVGITSSFTYSTSEPSFITQLTTPYGNSTFNDAVNSTDIPEPSTVWRGLRLTDPLGYTEFLYMLQNSTIVPASDPLGTPAGMSHVTNTLLEWRNTFYWNKHQFPLGVTVDGSGNITAEDVTKASLTHWYHDTYGLYISRQMSSIKQPLESRVWFDNYHSGAGVEYGTLDIPIQTGRILDDGSTQLSQASFYHDDVTTYVPWPLTQTDPLGRVTQYTYDTNLIDLLTVQQKTSSTGYTTIATYGSYTNHLPQTYTGPDGQTWHYTYTSAGQIKTVTDPNSNVTTYNYDTSGRLSTIVNANSQTVLTLTYDSADRVRTRTDSEGYVLTYDYDNLDRITKITYPDSTTDQYDYTFQSGTYAGTASLELRKYTDRLGRVTTYNYDADRRLTSVVEPTTSSTTRTTSYSYYEDGTLKEITDANGNVTHWDIDLESRPIDKIYAYGTSSAQTETYVYENNTSRLKSITDALGQVKTFTYAKDNRITGITYTSTVNPTPNVTFTWDTYFPRLSSMTDGLGTTNYSYAAVGTNGGLKLSSIDGPYSNDTISLSYDTIGRLSGRNISGGNETFGYDAINRLNSHGTPLGTFSFGYLGQTDQVNSQSVTNGSTTVSTSWSYDTNTNDRRLTGITNSGVSRSYSFGYGSSPVNVYDIMSITDTAASGHPWATQSRAYTYDYVDRLLTESVTTPGNSTFAYDNLDNATTWNTPASGSLTPTFNALNQLHTFGSNTYSFDADGNTLSGDGTRTYKWDAENRLIEVDYVGTSNKSVFSYDGLGHRTVDAETVSGTTTTTRYLWCGSRICQTRDGSDTVLRRDLPEGELNVSTGQKLVYMPDQLNSVRDVLDASTGNLIQSYDFTPYGAVARSNGSTPTDYQYAGLFVHPQSGLNFATYRVMDGVTGRWLNRDPIRERGGTNLYAYVYGNPERSFDPLGLAEGEFPPPPPGYNQSWPKGFQPDNRNPASGRSWVQDPATGNKYYAHPEDKGHWRHWDIEDQNGKPLGRCPAKSVKPWPTQKRPPYGDQSPVDPNGDAAPWSPDPAAEPADTPAGEPATPTQEPSTGAGGAAGAAGAAGAGSAIGAGTPPVLLPPMFGSPCFFMPQICNGGAVQ